VSVASQVSHSRSQWSVWNEGSPSEVGASGKVIARDPLAATRSTSAAARSGSQAGTRDSGMSRSGAVAHHSSSWKSFQARTHSSASSLSFARWNTPPPKPGNDGKHNAAWTPSRSMSLTRCTGS
jgi:hypothetical protein